MTSKRALALLRAPESSPAPADPMRVLAEALAPHLREILDLADREHELVDVLERVPGSRRAVLAACRSGTIADASKVGRRWLARRSAIDAWLRDRGPRAVPTVDDPDDDLAPMRSRLARGMR